MSTEHLLLFLLIGVAAGFLAGKIMRGVGYGLVGDLIIGVIGSFIETGFCTLPKGGGRMGSF